MGSYVVPREDAVVQLGHVLDGAELGVIPEVALDEAKVGNAGGVSRCTLRRQ